MSMTPTINESFARAPGADDFLRLPGWNSSEPREAEPDVRKIDPNTLSPDDVPYEAGPAVLYPHVVVKRFEHAPTITYRRGDTVETVTGPIMPAIPHMTEATRAGWEKWCGDRADHAEAAIESGRQRAAKRKAYFQQRDDKKEADWKDRCGRALAKGKPLPTRPKRRELPPDWLGYVKDTTLVAMINESRRCRSVAERMREYRYKNGIPIGGRVYAPFNESFEREDGTPAPAVRSWIGPISLSLFSSALPRGHVNYGNDKTTEYSTALDGRLRLFALDSSHVVLDKSRRCAFIVDLDGWWVSMEALRSHLRKLLPPEFMPNIVTARGRESDGAGVENPHLVWPLPPGSRVLRGKGKKNKEKFKLHEMVQAGIVSLLIPVGADPGHTNVCKTKNPLSPGYSIEVCDDFFPTMSDWRAFLPTITPDKREMQRRAKLHRASQQSGVEVNESQAIWNDGKAYRRIEIAAAQYRKDPEFLKARKKVATFVDWLYDDADGVVTLRLVDKHGDTPAVRAVLRAQRQYVVDLDMTPAAIGEWCDRGRDATLNAEEFEPLPPTATQEQRVARANLIKHLARQRTQANKESINCGLIAEEIEARLASGIPVIKSEVVNALVNSGTVKRSTAYNHFDRCLEIVQRTARYQDPYFSNISDQSGQQIEATPVIVSETASDNGTTVAEPVEPAVTVASVRNPAKTPRQTPPSWVVDKDTMIEWQDACWIRDEWGKAVAKWRKERRQPSGDVDLVNDEKFRAMVLDRSAWSHRRH